MAEKRMFSKTVVRSARFLQMPNTTQALYFHLCLDADDDGIVEAYATMRTVGSREDDLRLLIAKHFVTLLNLDLQIAYINDWHLHNTLRADRKKDSIYQQLLLEILPDAPIVSKKPRSDLKNMVLEDGRTMDSPRTGNGQSMDGVVEVSIVENNIEEYNNSPQAREEHKSEQISLILENGNWYIISQEEIDFYQKSFPKVDVVSSFRGLSSWCFSNEEKRKNKRSVKGLMDRWLRNEQEKLQEQSLRKSQSAVAKPVNNKFNNFPQREYEFDNLEKDLLMASMSERVREKTEED